MKTPSRIMVWRGIIGRFIRRRSMAIFAFRTPHGTEIEMGWLYATEAKRPEGSERARAVELYRDARKMGVLR